MFTLVSAMRPPTTSTHTLTPTPTLTSTLTSTSTLALTPTSARFPRLFLSSPPPPLLSPSFPVCLSKPTADDKPEPETEPVSEFQLLDSSFQTSKKPPNFLVRVVSNVKNNPKNTFLHLTSDVAFLFLPDWASRALDRVIDIVVETDQEEEKEQDGWSSDDHESLVVYRGYCEVPPSTSPTTLFLTVHCLSGPAFDPFVFQESYKLAPNPNPSIVIVTIQRFPKLRSSVY